VGLGFFRKNPKKTTEPNRKKPSQTGKTKPNRKNQAKIEKPEPKPSQTGRFDPVSVFFLKKIF
jgi:hypothetical protein